MNSLRKILADQDVVSLAQRVLGATVTTHLNGQITSGKIVETEAYRAPDDKGSHAYRNLRTSRTEVIFGKPGLAYVYLCYGIHHLLNIVTGPVGTAHAILIRAIEPCTGMTQMKDRRKILSSEINLTNGPGKLSSALGITTKLSGYDLLSFDETIQFKLSDPIDQNQIICSPRVGIAYAGKWAHKPWRFRIKDNKWTSLPHEVNYGNIN